MGKLLGFLAVLCVITICINMYLHSFSAIPQYLNVYHIIGASNRTRSQSKTPNHSQNKSIYLICPDLQKPNLIKVPANHGNFQKVNQQVFAFSAYYDHRPPRPAIKIVTASRVKHNDGLLLCQMWYEESCEPDVRQVFKVDVHHSFPGVR